MEKFYVIQYNERCGDFLVLEGPFSSVEQAKAKRYLSGDLIVDENYTPVLDQNWLWAWEIEREDSYAKRMINLAKSGKFYLAQKRYRRKPSHLPL